MLADSFSMESEWQQVSSSLRDSSQGSGRSQQFCSLNGVDPSSVFLIHQSFFLTFLRSFQLHQLLNCPFISKFSSPFINPSVTVPRAPITIEINVINNIIIILPIRVFHISISWWFFTGVWVTASLLKSPGLVSGSWPSLAMLSFG